MALKTQTTYCFRSLVALSLLICCIVFAGCDRSHPGNWKQPQVEAKIKERLQLAELSLAPDPAGGYSGSGKLADGETLKLKITQDEAAKRISWKAEGDRGTFEDGSYEFE